MKKATAVAVLSVSVLFMGIQAAAGDGLAVGAHSEDIGTVLNGGSINVLYSDAGGLTDLGSQMWNQNTAGIPGEAEQNDEFGTALAAGDFDSDGRDDLAVGVPYEGFNALDRAGVVHIFYGDVGGPASGLELWSQEGAVPGGPEEWDSFGYSLAVIRSGSATGLFADGFETGDTSAWSPAAR